MPKIKPYQDGDGSPQDEMEKQNKKAEREALKRRIKDKSDFLKDERRRRKGK